MLERWLNEIGDRLFGARQRFERSETFERLADLRADAGRWRRAKGLVLGGLAGVAGLAVALGLWLRPEPPPVPAGNGAQGSSHVWFYDLGSGQLFTQPATAVPPVPAPSNAETAGSPPAGVRAYVLSCGDCADASLRFVGFIERYPAPVAATDAPDGAGDARAAAGPGRIESGPMVAEPSPKPEWEDAASEEGKALVDAALGRCRGRTATKCAPGG